MKPHELALRVLICLEVKRGSARLLECRRPLNLGDPEEEERGQEAVGGVPAPGTGRPWLSPSPEVPCATPASPQPRAGLTPFPPSCPLLPIPLLPSPPHSCWEWRLHFSCHLHSQSIRTPQLSRLAELGGRRRRERVLWGLSPPHRSHSAPDCFLLRRAQPADQGGAQEPLELALPPRQARRPTAGARGGRGARGRAGDWRPSRRGRRAARGGPPTPRLTSRRH